MILKILLDDKHNRENVDTFLETFKDSSVDTDYESSPDFAVGYSTFQHLQFDGPHSFGRQMAKVFGRDLTVVRVGEDPDSSIRLEFDVAIPGNLIHHSLTTPTPSNSKQVFLHGVRGLIAHALTSGIASAAKTAHPDATTNYRVEEDSVTNGQILFASNIASEQFVEGKLLLTLTLNTEPDRMAAEQFIAGVSELEDIKPVKDLRRKPPFEARSFRERPFLKYAAYAGLAATLFPLVTGIYSLAKSSPIDGLLGRFEKADIPEKRAGAVDLAQMRLAMREFLSSRNASSVQSKMVPSEPIEDFELLNSPPRFEIDRMELLRSYVQLTTSLTVPDTLVVFKGRGAKGVNFSGETIGIHENVLKVDFQEALETFVHEVAHNYPVFDGDGHGNDWRHHYGAIEAAIREKLNQISLKQKLGSPLSAEEEVILDLPQRWERTH